MGLIDIHIGTNSPSPGRYKVIIQSCTGGTEVVIGKNLIYPKDFPFTLNTGGLFGDSCVIYRVEDEYSNCYCEGIYEDNFSVDFGVTYSSGSTIADYSFTASTIVLNDTKIDFTNEIYYNENDVRIITNSVTIPRGSKIGNTRVIIEDIDYESLNKSSVRFKDIQIDNNSFKTINKYDNISFVGQEKQYVNWIFESCCKTGEISVKVPYSSILEGFNSWVSSGFGIIHNNECYVPVSQGGDGSQGIYLSYDFESCDEIICECDLENWRAVDCCERKGIVVSVNSEIPPNLNGNQGFIFNGECYYFLSAGGTNPITNIQPQNYINDICRNENCPNCDEKYDGTNYLLTLSGCCDGVVVESNFSTEQLIEVGNTFFWDGNEVYYPQCYTIIDIETLPNSNTPLYTEITYLIFDTCEKCQINTYDCEDIPYNQVFNTFLRSCCDGYPQIQLDIIFTVVPEINDVILYNGICYQITSLQTSQSEPVMTITVDDIYGGSDPCKECEVDGNPCVPPSPSQSVTPTITPSVTITPTTTPTISLTPTTTQTPSVTTTPTTTPTISLTPTTTPTPTPLPNCIDDNAEGLIHENEGFTIYPSSTPTPTPSTSFNYVPPSIKTVFIYVPNLQ